MIADQTCQALNGTIGTDRSRGSARKSETSMILRQFLHTDPVALSYLFGCGGKAVAAIVDPVGEIAPYIQAAQNTGMRIRYVIDTHIHADHVSAGRQLSKGVGAEDLSFPSNRNAAAFPGTPRHEVPHLRHSASRGPPPPAHPAPPNCLCLVPDHA